MLQKLNFLPGFNKQLTPTQAEGQWVDGDNVRFRYNTPEKIGGWLQLGENDMTGAARAMHHVVNKSGNKFSIIGTNSLPPNLFTMRFVLSLLCNKSCKS